MSSKPQRFWDYSFIVFLGALFIAEPSFAQSQTVNITAQNVLQNIAAQLPNLMRLVTAIAYVSGMYFIMMGIFKLKQYGESRTMMSHERTLGPSIVMLAVGACLLYLPSAINVGLSTFWTNPNPYAYLNIQNSYSEVYADIFRVVQLFGLIAFIRGLVILSRVGQHAQPGTVGKGLTHIIGGIMCINIYEFIQVVFNTLGIQT